MKFLKFLILILLVNIITISCKKSEQINQTDTNNIEFNKDNLLNKGNYFGDHMAINNFTVFEDTFSEKLMSKLKINDFEKAYNDDVKNFGTYYRIYSIDFKEVNNLGQVNLILEFENGNLNVLFVFNKDEKLEGIWIKPITIESKVEKINNNDFEEFDIKIGEFKLNGLLTIPKKSPLNIVVIMVQGSGSSDMNETIGSSGNAPFKDIAHDFAAQGIKTIRFNKRFYENHELADKNVTIQKEVLDDVYSAIDFASKDERMKNDNIIILGHSLGGMLAPKIAQDNKLVKGLIIFAGTPRKLQDLILDQNIYSVNNYKDMPDDQKKDLLKRVNDEIELINNLDPNDNEGNLLMIEKTYWNSLNNIDIPSIVKNLDLPMIILQGSDDFQVFKDNDFELFKEILKDKNNVEFKLYDKLNHLFMTSKGKTDIMEYEEKDVVSKEVTSDIIKWLKSNF